MIKMAGNPQASDLPVWQLFIRVADKVPERDCVIWGGERASYGTVREHAARLAAWLQGHGLGRRRSRAELLAHESGQDHVAIYMQNRPEYVESVLGAFAASTVPVNVNYRYVAAELVELLSNSAARVLIYEACFADRVAEIRCRLPNLVHLIEVGGGARSAVNGAVRFQDIVAAGSTEFEDQTAGDDLCIIYTGGTTGSPKAVLWSQVELCLSMTTGTNPSTGGPIASLSDLSCGVEQVEYKIVILPPMMHLAGLSGVLTLLPSGATLLFPPGSGTFEPSAIWAMVEKERPQMIMSIGNAMGRPLLDELNRKTYDLSSLRGLINGAAPMSPEVRAGLLRHLNDTAYIFDSIGSSESGKQAQVLYRKGTRMPGAISASAPEGNRFSALPNTRVLSEDRTRLLDPTDNEIGWLASTGHLPFGYLGDARKSAETFPVVEGTRFAVPGDRARYDEQGRIEVLGRDSVTINSGGEKVFAEEVEAAILAHPGVTDAIVVGRASERWGAEVVGIVSHDGSVSEAAIRETCAQRLARYKLPKQIIFVDRVLRGPNGKADYRWAEQVARSFVSGSSGP